MFIGTGEDEKRPSKIWPKVPGIQDGQGAGCESTVTYGENCFDAGYLNYMMWGVINQRCYQSFKDHPRGFIWSWWYSSKMAMAWKYFEYSNIEAFPEITAAAQAGYVAWGASTPYTSTHRHCRIGAAGSAPSKNPWDFTWEPKILVGTWGSMKSLVP